MLSKSYLIVRF